MSKSKKPPRLQMKPTYLNTGFGDSSYNPLTGKVDYTLDPKLEQFRDFFYDSAEQYVPTQEEADFADYVKEYGAGLFERGANLDVGQVRDDYYNQFISALQPNRDQESAQLADTLFATGRTGLGVGRGNGYVNPEQFALLKAREEQNTQIMLSSEDRARAMQQQDLGMGLNYINTGNALAMMPYSNVATLFGQGANIENLGLGTLNTLGQFSQLQMGWQQAKQQNDAARAAASGGGLLGGIGNALVGGAVNAFTGGFGNSFAGLGASFGSSLFGGGGFDLGGLFGGGMPASQSFDYYYNMPRL